MRHTPGPWKYQPDWEMVTTEDQMFIARIETPRPHQDGPVIAAAPDLLEACEDYFAAEETMDPPAWRELAEDAMKKAIAKANGKAGSNGS